MKYHWQYETVRQCAKCWRLGRWKRDICSVCARSARPTIPHFHKCALCTEMCQSKQTYCWRCKRAGLVPVRTETSNENR